MVRIFPRDSRDLEPLFLEELVDVGGVQVKFRITPPIAFVHEADDAGDPTIADG